MHIAIGNYIGSKGSGGSWTPSDAIITEDIFYIITEDDYYIIQE
jgi:hypothetical protein